MLPNPSRATTVRLEKLPLPEIRAHRGSSPRPPYGDGFPEEGLLTYGHASLRFKYDNQKLWEPAALQNRLKIAVEAGRWISKNWVAAQFSFYQIPYNYKETGKQLQLKLIQAVDDGLCDEVPAETRAIEERLRAAYIPLWNDYVDRLIAWKDREEQMKREARARNGVPEPEEEQPGARNVRARYC
ncbi:hypothetical protein LTR97_002045 [Elasticomyces elasticus]|uniref:Uncharacterized protein n=1 Tax=Elasticomyces elasticus TaxID=574655 RepID=A0AAN7ZPZ9_9PEZI|nr:hypothetical protein LTR97_002045 [Elasticomyces elasticus]